MMNDDLEVTAQAPKKSSWKVFFGLILMILSVYLLYVFFKDSGGQAFNEYLSLTLACLWLSGLGYYFIRRGCSVVFNHNPQTKPKYAQQQGTKSDTKPEYKSMLQSESKSSPKPEPKSVPLQRTRYDSKPEPKLSDIITVEYKPNIEENLGSYPVLRIPKKGCVVRSHREGKTRRRGFKEEVFQNSINQYFGVHFLITGLARINTGGRPFEPDIAMIEKKNGNNVRIDIEIDEPYVGATRKPIHCGGEDYMRDTYFVDRGWVVIRFSEYQVHTREIDCLKFIAYIIQTIDSQYVFSTELKMPHYLQKEPSWDLLQAQKWEKERYREKYLGHEFGEIPEDEEVVDGYLNLQEQQEERQVEPTKIGTVNKEVRIGYNKINESERDARIEFYPDQHTYVVDGVPFSSVSSVSGRYFLEFDSEYWAKRKASSYNMTPEDLKLHWKSKGEVAARNGTLLHQQIESYFLGKELKKTEEFHLFEQFVHDHKTLTPYRTEWRVFDEKYRIAGTIDLFAKNGDHHEIYDWKRSEKVVNSYTEEPITQNQFQSGIGRLSDIPDTSYNRYCLQQGMYRYILENSYGISVSNMFLVVLHPSYKQYYKVEVPYLKRKVEYILNSIQTGN